MTSDPASDAFGRIAAHFTPAALGALIGERRTEVVRALLAEPVLTRESLLDALRAGQIPARRVRFFLDRRQIDLEKLRLGPDAPVPQNLIEQMMRQGGTLVCNHADRVIEPLHRLASLIGGELHERIEITAVLSFTERPGLHPHHDIGHLFIAQLEGEKDWVLLGEPVREGLPTDAFAGEEGPARTITLRAGDVLFVPAGQRHLCNPSPAGSLHLAILIYAPNGADARAALTEAMERDPELLRPYLAFAHEAARPERIARYRARLHELVDELDLEAILDDRARRAQPPPEVPFAQGGGTEMKTDPRIDAKIAGAAEFARPILEHWRALVHKTVPGVEEAIKWGMPHFVYKGKNIAGMAPFKAHCAVMVHGDGRQETEGMGSYGKLTKLSDLPPDAELVAKLQQAMGRIDRGEKEPWREAPPKPKKSLEVPEDFSDALAANSAAAQHWDRLAPSHRYEYLEWITEAKREQTRAKRIGEAVAWLGEGKRRNWKYER